MSGTKWNASKCNEQSLHFTFPWNVAAIVQVWKNNHFYKSIRNQSPDQQHALPWNEFCSSKVLELPSIIATNSPDTDCVNRLTVQNRKSFRIDKFQRAFIKIHVQIFALNSNTFQIKQKQIEEEHIDCRTSPHRPTTSNKSLRPKLKSTMQRLTALELRSGVKSSSAISTQPKERTEKRMAGDFGGEFRNSAEALAPSATGKLLRLLQKKRMNYKHWSILYESCSWLYLNAISSLERILSRSESVKLVVLLGTTGVKLALIACQRKKKRNN